MAKIRMAKNGADRIKSRIMQSAERGDTVFVTRVVAEGRVGAELRGLNPRLG